MKLLKRFVPVLLCGVLFAAAAAETELKLWSFGKTDLEVTLRNGGTLAFDPLRDSSGNPVLEIALPEKPGNYPVVAAFRSKTVPARKQKLAVEFEVRGSVPCRAEILIANGEAPYNYLSAVQSFDIPASWKRHRIVLAVTADTGGIGTAALPQFIFRNAPAGAKIDFGPIRVTDATSAAAAPAIREIREGKEWKAVDLSDLVVRAGSALDLSGITDRAPAGTYGRVTVNAAGQLVFEKRPDEELRFFSLQLLPGQAGMQYMSKAELEAYVDTIVRQGYNMVRIHGPGRFLVGPNRGAVLKNQERFELPQTPDELEFDPEIQDRFDYFIYLLKKNGVYVNLDGLVSFVGFSSDLNLSIAPRHPNSSKVQMFVNPARRRNWVAGVSKILTHVNPYTKTALRDDPVLALFQYYNEQDIRLDLREYSKAFQPLWVAFLKNRYGSYGKLYAAWGGKCGDVLLPENGTFEQVPEISFKVARTDTPAGIDMALFQSEREVEMTKFYEEETAKIGYRGLTTQWDMITRLVHLPARERMPVITMHGYHAHPSGYGGSKGITLNQKSPLAENGSAVKRQSTARWLDRPYLITEFGFVFWNRFRHEQGLVYAACAALQNWNGVACHCNQAVLYGDPLASFMVGVDPVGRASELVTAMGFLRRDIETSPHTIEIPVSRKFAFDGRAMGAIPDEISRMWIWSKVGISFDSRRRAPVRADLTVSPDGVAQSGGGDMFEEILATGETSRLERICAILKKKGILGRENRSDPARGIFESDTAQVYMDVNRAEMTVKTPRLEGAVVKQDRPVVLGVLSVLGCSVPASVTVVSLEKEATLATAKRLLAVIATDARNSGMKFSDANETVLEEIGSLPALVRTGKFRLAIARPDGERFRAYALKLNGERASELPVKNEAGRLVLDIDTAALPDGPAVFFELIHQ